MRSTFDHEKLQVYQDSLAFISWLEVLLQNVPKSARDQFNRASTSIALNLAEGNGKFTSPDRLPTFDNQQSCSCRFFSATWLNRTPVCGIRISIHPRQKRRGYVCLDESPTQAQ